MSLIFRLYVAKLFILLITFTFFVKKISGLTVFSLCGCLHVYKFQLLGGNRQRRYYVFT